MKQDGRGVWFARPYLGKTPAGREVKPYKSFPEAGDEEEALELAHAWVAGLTGGGRVPSMVLTDLLEDYVASLEINGASSNSVKAYRLFSGNYCARFLKKRRADELTVMDFNRFERSLLKEGGRGGRPLSKATVNGVYQFLRGAYRYFVKNGLCPDNPLLMAEKPVPDQREAIALEEWDFTALVRHLAGVLGGMSEDSNPREVVEAFADWLALHTGMRVGEVCALRRRDVMALRGFVHVGGTVEEKKSVGPVRKEKPKTSHSRRNVSMTDDEFATVHAFMAWQDAVFGWCGPDSPLVSIDGLFMRPSDVSAAFKALCKRLGIDAAATFHTLRHTHASWCLAEGVDIITLSERLGHADPSITMRIYGHVLSGRDAAAAAAFAAIAERVEKEART
ncbi:tyrosine-type recombinase/integrase [Eggerthella sp. HF-4214]|uniref:Tyrosine-type recombinase/integrase n=1 Tax=Eggerthella guodeyinii TaxID=2690837 RepID=A0A6N7RMN4_9ACTN|nr:tyrosine-type recombinase/integrase [Eggerthella guodeyinii]